MPWLCVPRTLMPGLIKTELTEEIDRRLFLFVDGSKKRVLAALKPELHQVRFRWVRRISITVYGLTVACQVYHVLCDGADHQMTVVRRRKHKNGTQPVLLANISEKHFLRPVAQQQIQLPAVSLCRKYNGHELPRYRISGDVHPVR